MRAVFFAVSPWLVAAAAALVADMRQIAPSGATFAAPTQWRAVLDVVARGMAARVRPGLFR